jgi:hypothetical protein
MHWRRRGKWQQRMVILASWIARGSRKLSCARRFPSSKARPFRCGEDDERISPFGARQSPHPTCPVGWPDPDRPATNHRENRRGPAVSVGPRAHPSRISRWQPNSVSSSSVCKSSSGTTATPSFRLEKGFKRHTHTHTGGHGV